MKNFKQDHILFDALSKMRVLCKCSHSVFIPNYLDRVICSYCGNWVYRTQQIEFQYKIKERLKKDE